MTRTIRVGTHQIGGGSPVVIQSMTNTDTRDAIHTLQQIEALAQAGCQVVRCAVPDAQAAEALYQICDQSPLPVVADVHFDYKLALASMAAGVHKVRINPGNIGALENVKVVANEAARRGIPIRIGVNSGSVEKDILARYGGPAAEALVESALGHAALLERFDFQDICISVKSSSVPTTMRAYQMLHERTTYPLHLGVTEAGTEYMGTVKSAAGIGGLLALGIGDTMRVSLTDDPVREIFAAKAILKAVGLHDEGVTVVSCPTCGRTRIDLIGIASEVERRVAQIQGVKLKGAVRGCAVNGPGEAREADLGIAGGDGEGLIFCKGKILRKVPQSCLVDELMREIEQYISHEES